MENVALYFYLKAPNYPYQIHAILVMEVMYTAEINKQGKYFILSTLPLTIAIGNRQ